MAHWVDGMLVRTERTETNLGCHVGKSANTESNAIARELQSKDFLNFEI